MDMKAELKVIWEILDKHLDQEAAGKEYAALKIKPWIEGVKAKVESGEIDIVPGTDIDKHAILSVLEFLMKQAGV